jgi:hypothetical protein
MKTAQDKGSVHRRFHAQAAGKGVGDAEFHDANLHAKKILGKKIRTEDTEESFLIFLP